MTQRVACITLWQPYASLIFTGHKCFETRGFRYPAKLTGQLLAIHAAARPLAQCGVSRALDVMCREVFGEDYATTLPRGALLGVARLGPCEPTTALRDDISQEDFDAGDWAEGRYCWRLDDATALPSPVPMKGKQGWSQVEVAA